MGAKSEAESVLFLRHPAGHWYVGWGAMNRSELAPLDRPAFFLPDFFGHDRYPWWVPQHFAKLSSEELLQKWPALAGAKTSLLNWSWQEPEQQLFTAECQTLLQQIDQGELRKAVPVVMSHTDHLPSAQEKIKWWADAMQVPSTWMAYGGWWGEEGLIGLTPEILFSSDGQEVITMALAGTAKNPGPSLFSSEKDQMEHQWVVQDLQQQLADLGSVTVEPTREWELGRLKHLRTDLRVRANAGFQALVNKLHPTPALGVAPRQAGLRWLERSIYAQKRRRFGAPFGVSIPDQLAFCCVAIRGLQWHEGKTWLSSGCGVVAGSRPDLEWQELKLKRQVVAEQFGFLGSRL